MQFSEEFIKSLVYGIWRITEGRKPARLLEIGVKSAHEKGALFVDIFDYIIR